MSASQAPTAKPSWAVTAWVDDRYIYIEIPSTKGNPYVQKYPITEGALSKALNFLRTRYELVPSAEKNYTKVPVEPGYVCQSVGASAVYRKQNKIVQTDEQRAIALNLLRKLGMV
jgi:hypothetical protein